jgi:hypothetical protein
MKFELYEVWTASAANGIETLVDTTSSNVEARIIANNALDIDVECAIIYRETEDGDLELVEEIVAE